MGGRDMKVAILRGMGVGVFFISYIQASAVAQAPSPYHALIADSPNQLQWKTAVAQTQPSGMVEPNNKGSSLPAPALLQQPAKSQPGIGSLTSQDSAKLAQLREDIAALIGATQDLTPMEVGAYSDRARLQGQLDELLKRLNSQVPKSGDFRSPSTPTVPKTKFDPNDTRPIDSLRLAMNLYRDNDFEAAYRAFSYIQPTQLPPEDRAFVRYMVASSLRRLNRLSEAAVIYREVAEMTEDEFIANSAISQLALMRAAEDLEAQLTQIRSRMKDR